jgi:hypothetical protein
MIEAAHQSDLSLELRNRIPVPSQVLQANALDRIGLVGPGVGAKVDGARRTGTDPRPENIIVDLLQAPAWK